MRVTQDLNSFGEIIAHATVQLMKKMQNKNWFTRHETDRFLNNHCQESVRAYIHDCLSFLHEVMIGNHRNKTTEI